MAKVTANVEVRPRLVGLEVEVERPKDPASGWRWFVAYHLLKLAARVYPFKLEFVRTEEWHDRLEH